MSEDTDIKVVIIVSPHLDKGPAANRTAVLGVGLAGHIPNMVGQNLITKDGVTLLGITQIPIPILVARPDMSLLDMVNQAQEKGCKAVVFLGRAQGMTSYEEYRQSVANCDYKDLDIDAIGIWGNKKQVTKLTGNLPSLR